MSFHLWVKSLRNWLFWLSQHVMSHHSPPLQVTNNTRSADFKNGSCARSTLPDPTCKLAYFLSFHWLQEWNLLLSFVVMSFMQFDYHAHPTYDFPSASVQFEDHFNDHAFPVMSTTRFVQLPSLARRNVQRFLMTLKTWIGCGRTSSWHNIYIYIYT